MYLYTYMYMMYICVYIHTYTHPPYIFCIQFKKETVEEETKNSFWKRLTLSGEARVE